jgi:hypothetical protein
VRQGEVSYGSPRCVPVASLALPDADAGNYTAAAVGVRTGGTVVERR